MNTLFRLINTVFSGEEFENQHPKVDLDSIYNCFSNIPYPVSYTHLTLPTIYSV